MQTLNRLIFASLLAVFAIMLVMALFLSAAVAWGATSSSAAVSWVAPTLNTDGTPITGTVTYNLYQGLTGAEVKSQSGLTATSVTVTSGLTQGSTQCFTVTAVVNAVESAQTPEACVPIPKATPNTPTQVSVIIH